MGNQASPMKALVTGGGGFLARAIVRQLLERGGQVTVLVRRPLTDLDAQGVRVVLGDLEDRVAVGQSCQGCDTVFHVAAKAGIWGTWAQYYGSNVEGTRNVLEACRTAGITRLVHTSSPSVTFDGGDARGADESLPYPERYLNFYSETKAMAERMVLAADTPGALRTVALRPHLIWGPGDPHIMPRVLERARRRQLVRVGKGTNWVDMTYVENAAQAHILAADRLLEGSPVCGRAYFISNGEPVELWPWIDNLLSRLSIPRVRRSLPLWAAWTLGALMEWIYRLLDLRGEPRMTRFLAGQLGTSHYYNIEAARRDLGYTPQVSMAEGLERLLQKQEELCLR